MKTMNNIVPDSKLKGLFGIEILNNYEMFRIRGGGDDSKEDDKGVVVIIPKEL
jgi:hypothetical protein